MGEHLRRLRESLVQLSEKVLERAVRHQLEPRLRRQAANTFVAAMLDHANANRIGASSPDLRGAARVVGLAVQPSA